MPNDSRHDEVADETLATDGKGSSALRTLEKPSKSNALARCDSPSRPLTAFEMFAAASKPPRRLDRAVAASGIDDPALPGVRARPARNIAGGPVDGPGVSAEA
jgi:hypothetical protein